MMRFAKPLVVSIGLIIASTSRILSDDSAMNDGRYGPEPIGGYEGKESVIAMTSEHLRFKFGKQFTDVSATFTFRSGKKGAAAKQIVGFPDIGAAVEETFRRNSDLDAAAKELHRRNPGADAKATDDMLNRRFGHFFVNSFIEGDFAGPLQHLQTFVDGAEVKSELKYGFVNENDDGTWRGATPTTGVLMAWYVVPVSFPPERDVVIERRYRAPTGNAVYGILFFDYITHTGSNWRGPIGELLAEVELRDGLTIDDLAWDETKQPFAVTKPSKSQWQIIDPTHLRLTWHNFKPRDEPNRQIISLVMKATKPEE